MTAELWAALDDTGYHAGRVLLSVLWQSSLLLAIAGVLCLALRRHPARIRHALLAGALLLAPALPLLSRGVALVGAPCAEVVAIPEYSPATTHVTPAEPVEPTAARVDAEPAMATASEAITDASPAPRPLPARLRPTDFPWALGLLGYASCVAVLLSLVLAGRLRIAAWVRGAKPVTDGRVLDAFSAAAGRLAMLRRPLVATSDGLSAPMAVGALRPVVLLPVAFAENLRDDELLAVAVHELSHVKRRDMLVLSLVSLVRAALFFNPLVWLAARHLSRLAESACDDAVLAAGSTPVGYAKMLTRLAEQLPRHAFAAEMTAGIVLTRGAFLRRVEAILSDRRGRVSKLSRLALAIVGMAFALSVAVSAAVPLGTKPTSDDAGATPATESSSRPPLTDDAPPTAGPPVIERTLNDDDVGTDCFLDLDTGKLLTPPADLRTEAAMRQWARENGAELMGSIDKLVCLAGTDAMEVARPNWDAAGLQLLLLGSPERPGALVLPVDRDALPATYVFRTREGSSGILQVVGFGADPARMMIRYRLHKTAPSAVMLPFLGTWTGRAHLTLNLNVSTDVNGKPLVTVTGPFAAGGMARGQNVKVEGGKLEFQVLHATGTMMQMVLEQNGDRLTGEASPVEGRGKAFPVALRRSNGRAEELRPAAAGPRFIRFGPMVVNLNEPRMTRYLKINLALKASAEDGDVLARILAGERKAVFEDWIVTHLSELKLDDLRGPAAMIRLRRDILAGFNELLADDGVKLEGVLFTEFNVQ
jgi:beta-lactamase regulating signal transducer with metallopeptidase domain/flagellar basal body-associated protein FliL